jgi:hypothetical protein
MYKQISFLVYQQNEEYEASLRLDRAKVYIIFPVPSNRKVLVTIGEAAFPTKSA